ncbi:hypothetical protein ACE106_07235 [Shouchella clausii]|uniref:hypothetical protein n=1 Tax=Shouchella clausii TaxID=79880 RepID=UPI00289AB620|nr:hypothetical protein [Shouchella clausii]
MKKKLSKVDYFELRMEGKSDFWIAREYCIGRLGLNQLKRSWGFYPKVNDDFAVFEKRVKEGQAYEPVKASTSGHSNG